MLLPVVLALVSCDAAAGTGDDEVVIVARTSVIGDIAAGVAGDEARIEVLIPIGVDAHDFSPSSQQAGLVATADIVVATGLGLEEGLTDVIAAAAQDGVTVLELAPLVDPIPFQSGNGSLDPHFWMDPLRAAEAARLLARAIAEQALGAWEARGDAYARAMEQAEAMMTSSLSTIPSADRAMVTNHESLGYFADRFDFEILGVVIPGGSTVAEPSSAHLADLVETMGESGTNVVFAETTEPTSLAEAITAELGEEAEVVELYTESLGEPGSGADTLSGMLTTNARRISEALS